MNTRFYLDCYADVIEGFCDDLQPEIITKATDVLVENYLKDDATDTVKDFIVEVLMNYPVTTIIEKQPYELMDIIYKFAIDMTYNRAFKYFNATNAFASKNSFAPIEKELRETKLSYVVDAINSMEDGKPNDFIKGLFNATGNQFENEYNKLEITLKIKSDGVNTDYPELHQRLLDVFEDAKNVSFNENIKNGNGTFSLTSINKKDRNIFLTTEACKVFIECGLNFTDMHIKTSDKE